MGLPTVAGFAALEATPESFPSGRGVRFAFRHEGGGTVEVVAFPRDDTRPAYAHRGEWTVFYNGPHGPSVPGNALEALLGEVVQRLGRRSVPSAWRLPPQTPRMGDGASGSRRPGGDPPTGLLAPALAPIATVGTTPDHHSLPARPEQTVAWMALVAILTSIPLGFRGRWQYVGAAWRKLAPPERRTLLLAYLGAGLWAVLWPRAMVQVWTGEDLFNSAYFGDTDAKYGYGATIIHGMLLRWWPLADAVLIVHAMVGFLWLPLWAELVARMGGGPRAMAPTVVLMGTTPMVVWNTHSESNFIIALAALAWALTAGIPSPCQAGSPDASPPMDRPQSPTVYRWEALSAGLAAWGGITLAMGCRPEMALLAPLTFAVGLWMAPHDSTGNTLGWGRTGRRALFAALAPLVVLIVIDGLTSYRHGETRDTLPTWYAILGAVFDPATFGMPILPGEMEPDFTRPALLRPSLFPLSLVGLAVGVWWGTSVKFRWGIMMLTLAWWVPSVIDMPPPSVPRLHLPLAILVCLLAAGAWPALEGMWTSAVARGLPSTSPSLPPTRGWSRPWLGNPMVMIAGGLVVVSLHTIATAVTLPRLLAWGNPREEVAARVLALGELAPQGLPKGTKWVRLQADDRPADKVARATANYAWVHDHGRESLWSIGRFLALPEYRRMGPVFMEVNARCYARQRHLPSGNEAPSGSKRAGTPTGEDVVSRKPAALREPAPSAPGDPPIVQSALSLPAAPGALHPACNRLLAEIRRPHFHSTLRHVRVTVPNRRFADYDDWWPMDHTLTLHFALRVPTKAEGIPSESKSTP